MKKLILIISIFISWIYLANFIGAITVTKNSWEILDNTTWSNISSLTNKIDVSWSNIKLNWKLYVTWKICDNSWNCLWDIKKWLTSDNPWLSCLDIQNSWVTQDGIYWIKPDANPAYQVYCNMTFDDWWWTLIHVWQTATNGREFKWDGSCSLLNQHCNYKVNNTLVDASNKVLFHTDNNYWAKLNYNKTWKWALAMKDDASRWVSNWASWLTFMEDWPSVSRSEYWNQFRDHWGWILFGNDGHYWVMSLSYYTSNNGWMQDWPTNSSTHTINVFIK